MEYIDYQLIIINIEKYSKKVEKILDNPKKALIFVVLFGDNPSLTKLLTPERDACLTY